MGILGQSSTIKCGGVAFEKIVMSVCGMRVCMCMHMCVFVFVNVCTHVYACVRCGTAAGCWWGGTNSKETSVSES